MDYRQFYSDKKILVTGGGGFIGSHLASHLLQCGARFVRVADLKKNEFFEEEDQVQYYTEFKKADLRDPGQCSFVVQDIDVVFHFAANMGGMGTIHDANSSVIIADNARIDLNMLEACRKSGTVGHFFYASSACIYPENMQDFLCDDERRQSMIEHGLKEGDAWKGRPQDAYGIEKLFAEETAQSFERNGHFQVKIARFHNIFGPFCVWRGGREKAPAATCRKVSVAEHLGHDKIEVWGDGRQFRSYCYIDDAVEAVLRLVSLESGRDGGGQLNTALNIGSTRTISADGLTRLVLDLSRSRKKIVHNTKGPRGVGGRNSNNELLAKTLNFEPRTSLEQGMRSTYEWISKQVKKCPDIGTNDVLGHEVRDATIPGDDEHEYHSLKQNIIRATNEGKSPTMPPNWTVLLRILDEAIHRRNEQGQGIPRDKDYGVLFAARGIVRQILGDLWGSLQDFEEVLRESISGDLLQLALLGSCRVLSALGFQERSVERFLESNLPSQNAFGLGGRRYDIRFCLGLSESVSQDLDSKDRIDDFEELVKNKETSGDERKLAMCLCHTLALGRFKRAALIAQRTGNELKKNLVNEIEKIDELPQSINSEETLRSLEILLRGVRGWFSVDEAFTLFSLIVDRVPPSSESIVEIGSFHGRSTVVLAEAIRDHRGNLKVLAIDPHSGLAGYGPNESYENLLSHLGQKSPEAHGRVEVIQDTSTGYFESASASATPPRIGLLFIDAVHDYTNVKNDFVKWSQHVVFDGFVAFHDTFMGGVSSFLTRIILGKEDSEDTTWEPLGLRDSLFVIQKKKFSREESSGIDRQALLERRFAWLRFLASVHEDFEKWSASGNSEREEEWFDFVDQYIQ